MLMRLLTSILSDLTPKKTKIHLAQHNKYEHPMDVYLAGEFDEWQSSQTRDNFTKEFLIGFVEIPGSPRWLMTGVYNELKIIETKLDEEGKQNHIYSYRKRSEFAELEGRLVMEYSKPRANYLLLENCYQDLKLSAILESKMTVGRFPGFKEVDISHKELKIIVKQGLESWQTALSSVAGVYLISDRTKDEELLYVGSATGTEGLWDRWCNYANNGHGDNTRIRDLHAKRGKDFAENFRFSILEIADKHTGKEEMRLKENHWKRRLLTRDSGLNGN
ncbi:GIY-YIG nuclease family protein [Pseudomonas hormoni]|uniref:GIY-YIG nuclease family protein n=2 Tax=Pseudomonas hormoni TaxID=3093767 RepID=A0ABX8F4U0_9PSED|nr:GIY-YIG nuclease family protein [Pseudomonas hormoni]